MDGDTLHPIGELARRTGLTVKTIRFYSDRGIVPPAGRTPAGYRLYGSDAVARLDLVRTLRELGLDLPTIRKVVDRELPLPDVAAAHAAALAVRIRALRLRHAVLTAVARRGSTPEEMEHMHELAGLSEDERRRLVGDFLDAVFGGTDAGPASAGEIACPTTRLTAAPAAGPLAGVMRSMTPELPDDPADEQLDAWLELAELSRDPDFRAAVRRLMEDDAADRAVAGAGAVPRRDPVAVVRDTAGPAMTAGIDPDSPRADPVVASVTAHYADLLGRPDDTALRHRLLARLTAAGDPRRERYLRLLAVINGWQAPESLTPVLDWFDRALRARTPA
ncbi:MerR family transcriptional regulator [Streptomyces sp. NPDC057307]|uniref:MerR family transcriptional regulator n=1 Tax=Streptomyces sp. NPDC057307 TaxID=3346096 RepID=UPI003636B2FE